MAEGEDADAGLLLWGEQANVVPEWVATTRVRIRKRIVTEIQTLEVAVRREELVISRELLRPDEAYVLDIGHEPLLPDKQVYVLRAEVPSVILHVLPVERVTVQVTRQDGERELTVALQAPRVELSGETTKDQ